MNSARRCPQCGQEFLNDGQYFPFCSKRCKLLDLGAWASERYRIAGKNSDQPAQSDVHERSRSEDETE